MSTCSELLAQLRAAKAAGDQDEYNRIYALMEAENCQPMPEKASGGTPPPPPPGSEG
jgi:hypothetical protein